MATKLLRIGKGKVVLAPPKALVNDIKTRNFYIRNSVIYIFKRLIA
jgi:hypothetical protein